MVSFSVFPENHKKIDWNDSQIKWYSYAEGMEQTKKTKKPGMLIIYADWCPTCKKYSTLFSNSSVVQSMNGLILMRENRDTNPRINKMFNYDGEYVPRTFALNNKGKVMQKFYVEEEKYTYFIPPSSVEFINQFARLIKQFGK